jgi:hypothetical protein
MKKGLFLILITILSACQSTMMTGTSTPITDTIQPSSTLTASPTKTFTQIPTQTVIPPTITPIPFSVCCPLEDETFDSLPLILVNPLDIPPFGQDVGHHGVDFAYFKRGERQSIQGIEIYAILSGKTVLTLEDDIPYGYAIMLETPLIGLPESLADTLLSGYLPVPEDPHYRLYCPPIDPPIHTGQYSIYHLYAHMEERPTFEPGEWVSCGEELGTVGNTGYSSNPHLHLETRLGPSDASFSTMAHYENTDTLEQMANYCLWRMSGYYQLFDPFILFQAQFTSP